MPVFELVTEPMARVDLSYKEIYLLCVAVSEMESGKGHDDIRTEFRDLEVFFVEVLDRMNEAA